jgi:SAM-dependent methyltransferase
MKFWEAAAPGWIRRQALMRQFAAPVSHAMVQAIEPQPGQRVLELAGGLGETGMLAAELVRPGGYVIISDQAPAMLDGARARASELQLDNIRFQPLNGEWIDLPVASVDAVLCRFGFMLMADPLTALVETRRVLAPGGHLALAVWDAAAHNPWALQPATELIERGLLGAPAGRDQFEPGPFALGNASHLQRLLDDAGFIEPTVQPLELSQRHTSFEDFWETMLDLSRVTHDAVMTRPEEEIAEISAAIAQRMAPHTASDGTLEIPGRALLGVASA